MNQPAASPTPPLGATKLIGEAFRVLFRNFGVLFPLALAPTLLQVALMIWLVPGMDEMSVEQVMRPGYFLAMALGTAIGYVTIAMVMLATMDRLEGTSRGLGDYVGKAVSSLLPIIVLGLLISLASGIAMLAFIVPGLYVVAQFFVWLPCVLFEDQGMGALSRAQELTKGYRWPLVGALLIFFVLTLGLILLLAPLMASGFAGPGTLVTAVLDALIQAMGYAVFGIYTTLVYRSLRGIKEGVSF